MREAASCWRLEICPWFPNMKESWDWETLPLPSHLYKGREPRRHPCWPRLAPLPSIPASGRKRGQGWAGSSLPRQAASQRPDLARLFKQMAQFPLVFVVQTIPDKS